MGIQIVTHSSKYPKAVATTHAAAISKQLTEMAKRWRVQSLAVSTRSHPSWSQCLVLDSLDQAGALGYHDVDDNGKPYIKIGVDVTLDAGLSVSSVISHECCELLADQFCQMWAYSGRSLVALEVCDPVQDQSYRIDGMEVSNYVLPSWFQADSEGPWDALGELDGPFSYSAGGYLITMTAGRIQYVNAARALVDRSFSRRGRTWWRTIDAALMG
jgi:hypothetical protein